MSAASFSEDFLDDSFNLLDINPQTFTKSLDKIEEEILSLENFKTKEEVKLFFQDLSIKHKNVSAEFSLQKDSVITLFETGVKLKELGLRKDLLEILWVKYAGKVYPIVPKRFTGNNKDIILSSDVLEEMQSFNQCVPKIHSKMLNGVMMMTNVVMGKEMNTNQTVFIQSGAYPFSSVQFEFLKHLRSGASHTGLRKMKFEKIYYFEVSIVSLPTHESSCAGIGLAHRFYTKGFSGWYEGSIAMHSDIGCAFDECLTINEMRNKKLERDKEKISTGESEDEYIEKYIKRMEEFKYAQGDVIGVGCESLGYDKFKIFFTKNGILSEDFIHKELTDENSETIEGKAGLFELNLHPIFNIYNPLYNVSRAVFSINDGSDTISNPFSYSLLNVSSPFKLKSSKLFVFSDCSIIITSPQTSPPLTSIGAASEVN